jgi:hypothetical protein
MARPEYQVQVTERDCFLSESTLEAVEQLVEKLFPPAPFQRSFFSLDIDRTPEFGSHICDSCPSRATCRDGWCCDAYIKYASLDLGLDIASLYSRRPVFRVAEVEDGRRPRVDPLSPGFNDWSRDEQRGVTFAFATEGAATAGEILARPCDRQRLRISPEAPVRKVRSDVVPVDSTRILSLHRDGVTPSRICRELGLPRKAVSRVLAGDMSVMVRRPRAHSMAEWRELRAQGLSPAEIARQDGHHPAKAKKPRGLKSTGPEISAALRQAIAAIRGQTVDELDLTIGWEPGTKGGHRQKAYPVGEWRQLKAAGFSHLAMGEVYGVHSSLIQKKLSGVR